MVLNTENHPEKNKASGAETKKKTTVSKAKREANKEKLILTLCVLFTISTLTLITLQGFKQITIDTFLILILVLGFAPWIILMLKIKTVKITKDGVEFTVKDVEATVASSEKDIKAITQTENKDNRSPVDINKFIPMQADEFADKNTKLILIKAQIGSTLKAILEKNFNQILSENAIEKTMKSKEYNHLSQLSLPSLLETMRDKNMIENQEYHLIFDILPILDLALRGEGDELSDDLMERIRTIASNILLSLKNHLK